MEKGSYQNDQAKDEQDMIDAIVKIMRENPNKIRAIYQIAIGLSLNNNKNEHK